MAKRQHTLTVILALVAVLVLVMAFPAMAGDVGRYQAFPWDDDWFILDTAEGHMWTWRDKEVVYGGQLKPGKPGLTLPQTERLGELEKMEARAANRRFKEQREKEEKNGSLSVEELDYRWWGVGETGRDLTPAEVEELKQLRSKVVR
jgi:hypothetical protein